MPRVAYDTLHLLVVCLELPQYQTTGCEPNCNSTPTQRVTASAMVTSMSFSSVDIGPIFSRRAAASMGASGVSFTSGGTSCTTSARIAVRVQGSQHQGQAASKCSSHWNHRPPYACYLPPNL